MSATVTREENQQTNLVPGYFVELVEKDGQHFYSVNKSPSWFPGVTGILAHLSKEAIVPWTARETSLYWQKIMLKVNGHALDEKFFDLLMRRAKKQPRFIKERAGRIGSHAHKVFDSIVKKEKEVAGTTPFMESFEYWLKTEKLEIIGGDTKIASLEYGYGGSLDALALDENGDLVIIDFKTGNSLWDSHSYQVAAYSQAFKETYGLAYRPGGVVIRFVKDKEKYERVECRDINDSFLGFKAALDASNVSKLVHFHNRKLMKPPKKEKLKNAAA